MQTLVHRVLDSLYSCFIFSCRRHGVNNVPLVDHAVELSGVNNALLVGHAVELNGVNNQLVDHAVELSGVNSAPLVDHAVELNGVNSAPLLDHAVELRGGELRALVRDFVRWNTISGRMGLRLAW